MRLDEKSGRGDVRYGAESWSAVHRRCHRPDATLGMGAVGSAAGSTRKGSDARTADWDVDSARLRAIWR